jgi:hypothetical protein
LFGILVKGWGVGWLGLDGRTIGFAPVSLKAVGDSLTALDLADDFFIGSIDQKDFN